MSWTVKKLTLVFCFGWCLTSRLTLTFSFLDIGREGCPTCEDKFCPKSEDDCRHGLIRDTCGCCPGGVCALAEREKCFDPDYGVKFSESGLGRYSSCGEKMDCVRTDERPNARPESLCVCKHKGPICGSDNMTYESLCEIMYPGIYFSHYGPCVTNPVIVSRPESTYSYEGGSFALDCEAKGFPVPTIAWEFRSYDGFFAILPRDDPRIVVHSRGGPENYMVTSWLQIETLWKNDSGTYICIAKSSEGEDRAMTTIQVSPYSR